MFIKTVFGILQWHKQPADFQLHLVTETEIPTMYEIYRANEIDSLWIRSFSSQISLQANISFDHVAGVDVSRLIH